MINETIASPIISSSLRLTNTLTNQLELFRPLMAGQVSIYCCGVTVYDLCHLGHARSYIVWDSLRRYLIWLGYSVTFVQNFTDIDDKILARAVKEGSSMKEVSEKNISAFHRDMDSLRIMRPDRMPRATKSLEGICLLIKELEAKGVAYSVDGDVYFSVIRHSDYGKLSGREIQSQLRNADGRITQEEVDRKRNAFDFSLWKKAKTGEPSFPSPWGEGRPGWHIECSAMIRQELGETIDIHLGGSDLIFPHHENEIAQSEVANEKQLARYWLHNGMVNVGGQKMSKSLGNFTTIRSLLDSGISAMTLKLFVLQAHYRKPLDFTEEALSAASKGWKGLDSALAFGIKYASALGIDENQRQQIALKPKINQRENDKDLSLLYKRFINAMDDDLNTSSALAVLFDIARPLRSASNSLKRGGTLEALNLKRDVLYQRWLTLVDLASVLGLAHEEGEDLAVGYKDDVDVSKIEEFISERNEAKIKRDYQRADKIRNDLRDLGIELIDRPGGKTDWINC